MEFVSELTLFLALMFGAWKGLGGVMSGAPERRPGGFYAVTWYIVSTAATFLLLWATGAFSEIM